jgi:hypothetical protein
MSGVAMFGSLWDGLGNERTCCRGVRLICAMGTCGGWLTKSKPASPVRAYFLAYVPRLSSWMYVCAAYLWVYRSSKDHLIHTKSDVILCEPFFILFSFLARLHVWRLVFFLCVCVCVQRMQKCNKEAHWVVQMCRRRSPLGLRDVIRKQCLCWLYSKSLGLKEKNSRTYLLTYLWTVLIFWTNANIEMPDYKNLRLFNDSQLLYLPFCPWFFLVW